MPVLQGGFILDDVMLRFRDPAPSARQFPPKYVRRIVDLAWDNVYKQVVGIQENYSTKSAMISFVLDRQNYTLPDDFFKMRQVRRTGGVSDEYPLWPTTSTNKDLGSATWPLPRNQVVTDSNSATPETYYLEGNMIGFIPIPAAAQTDAVTLEYVPASPALSYSTLIWKSLGTTAEVESGNIDAVAGVSGLANDNISDWKMLIDAALPGWTTYSASIDTTDPYVGDSCLEFVGTTQNTSEQKASQMLYGILYTSIGSETPAIDPINLGNDTSDWFVFPLYINNPSFLNSSAGAGGVEVVISCGSYLGIIFASSTTNTGISAGWNLFAIQKSSFTLSVGSSWSSVLGIAVQTLWRGGNADSIVWRGDDMAVIPNNDIVWTSRTSLGGGLNVISPSDARLVLPRYAGVGIAGGLDEWIVLEALLRLQSAVGDPAAVGTARLRDEVKWSTINTLSDRSLQTLPRIGESRRRF